MGIMALFNSYYWIPFGAYTAFWSCPLTPAIPLQLILAVSLKSLYARITHLKQAKSDVTDMSNINTQIKD